jgi:hypothetical protein
LNKKRQIKLHSFVDENTKYVSKMKIKFLKYYEEDFPIKLDTLNMNIEPVFYSKEKYNEILSNANNDIEKKWKTRLLFEYTPLGNIIMFYDSYKQGFGYYSDTTSVPYNILNAVSMKYVITYNCLDFFMDNEITPKEKESPFIKLYINDEETTEKNSKDYEKELIKKNNKDFQKQIMNAPFIKHKKNGNNTKDSKKEAKIVFNRNRFIYLGKMMNFNIIQKEQKKNKMNNFNSNLVDNLNNNDILQKKVLSYQDYKQKLLNK